VDTGETVILKGRGISFSKWPPWYQKKLRLYPMLSIIFVYYVSKQMKTGYNKLSLSYR